MRYSIDSQALILSVSEEWSEFAAANGAPALTEESVLGRSLWDFVAGRATKQVYEQLFRTVRTTGAEVSVPFRCDGPSVRRYMGLTIRAAGPDNLEITSHTILEEDRPAVELFKADGPRSTGLIVMCSSCCRIAASPTEWLETEVAAEVLGLFLQPNPPRLAYDVCPACRASMLGPRAE